MDDHYEELLELLKKIIETPSVTGNEKKVSDILFKNLKEHHYNPKKIGYNVLCYGVNYNRKKPNLLLNAHMDTVKPVSGWTKNPFKATIEKGRLYGLGSNDDSAGLVSLLHTFYELDKEDQPYNPVFLATAEEEKNGAEGMKKIVNRRRKIKMDVALIGEPTGMQPAIAEKGLLVLDFKVKGVAGHAAREEGVNALYRAVDLIKEATELIDKLRNHPFDRKSELLGNLKFTITMINAGTQHNVIPDECTFTADVRTNELYSNKEVLDIIKAELPPYCEVTPRSLNLNSSRIPTTNPIIRKALSMGLTPYGSPTLSDQAVLDCPSFKLGPGDSARSHTADEYIELDELKQAVPTYVKLLDGLNISE